MPHYLIAARAGAKRLQLDGCRAFLQIELLIVFIIAAVFFESVIITVERVRGHAGRAHRMLKDGVSEMLPPLKALQSERCRREVLLRSAAKITCGAGNNHSVSYLVPVKGEP